MENETYSLLTAIFGSTDVVKSLSDGEDRLDPERDEPTLVGDVALTNSAEPADPFDAFFQRVQSEQTLRKSSGNIFDIEVPERTPAKAVPAGDFAKNSAARFAKFEAAVLKVFGDSDEGKQVLEIGKRQLAEAQAEILAA